MLFVSLSVIATAQNKDSLLRLIPGAKDTKERIRLMYEIMGDSGDNDPVKALHYYKALLALTQKLNDKVAEAVVQVETGYALYMMGNTVAGSELLHKATRMAEETGNQQAIGIAYDNLAFVYDDPQKQKELLKKALVASTAAKDYLFMCYELSGLADNFGWQNQWDSSLHYAQLALALSIAQDVKEMKASSLVQMGWHNYRMGQKPVALSFFQSAMQDPFTSIDAKTGGAVYGALSVYYHRVKREDSALHYAKSAYQSVKDAFYSIQLIPVITLRKAYKRANMVDSAYKYLMMENVIRDSIESKDKAQQIQGHILVEEQRQQTLNEERKHTIQYSAIALGVAAFLIGFLLLSHSIIANQKLIRFLGVITLLIIFEFLNLLLHPWLGAITHHSPVLMLLAMVCLAALLIPLHHKLEHWITHRMVEKNNRIRLAAAKRTIQQLEGTTG